MTFAIINNGVITQYPVSVSEVRQKYPSVSFPADLDGFDFTGFDVVSVVTIDPPSFNSNVEYIEEGTPVFDGQQWNQVWNTIALTADELQKRTEQMARGIRAQRNEKLAATDWRVTYEVEKAAVDGLGIQFPLNWATYRQALRDITSQSGFPHNVTWPEEPST